MSGGRSNALVPHPTSGEMIPRAQATAVFDEILRGQKNSEQFALALQQSGIPPARFMRQARSLITRVPDLLLCPLPTILGAMMDAAEVGLELAAPLGEAYVLPFYDKRMRCKVATFVPGYKGLVKLVRQGDVTSVYAAVVRENDHFEYEEGLDRKVVHRFDWRKPPEERGAPIGCYGIAKMKDGSHEQVWMHASEIERIRIRSPGGGSPEKPANAWATDPEAMWQKTAIRRVCSRLPKSERAARAVEIAGLADSGKPEVRSIDAIVTDAPPKPPSSGDALLDRARQGQQPEGPPVIDADPVPPGGQDAPDPETEPPLDPPPPQEWDAEESARIDQQLADEERAARERMGAPSEDGSNPALF